MSFVSLNNAVCNSRNLDKYDLFISSQVSSVLHNCFDIMLQQFSRLVIAQAKNKQKTFGCPPHLLPGWNGQADFFFFTFFFFNIIFLNYIITIQNGVYGAILLINHFINYSNQLRSVENCLDMFKINFNFERRKKNLFLEFQKPGRYSFVQ